MRTFEIMLDDLTEEAQQRFLEFEGVERAEDGNYDFWPITIIDVEE